MTDERNGPEETFHDTERKLRERIKALERERSLWRNECWMMREAWVEQKAALAAMTADRDDARAYAAEVRIREKRAEDARIAAEARLAKAVEALRLLSCKCPSNCDWEHDDVCPSWTARATLAEMGDATDADL